MVTLKDFPIELILEVFNDVLNSPLDAESNRFYFRSVFQGFKTDNKEQQSYRLSLINARESQMDEGY